MLRQVLVVVMGHVDAGKTSLLDAIRSTAIASREAGGITQNIGASEIPVSVVNDLAKDLLTKTGITLNIPGILTIDTPGHEAFANLRKRGGSVADIAVLVVDAAKGLEPQTLESLNILRDYKTPFIVAVNKIDAVTGYIPAKNSSFADMIAKQRADYQARLDERLYSIIGQFYEHGFSAERYDRVSDFTKQILIVPVSARERVGLPEILLYSAGLAQKFLDKQLQVSEQGKGSILEVKEEKGLGKTLDVILYDGVVRENDTIVFASAEGPVVSKVKALLRPKPLDEMRDPRFKFASVPEVHAAAGVKIACPDAERALAGSTLVVARSAAEEASAREEIAAEMQEILVDAQDDGVILRAEALGSLEAITKLFADEKIPLRKALLGPPTRKDMMEASSVQQKNRFAGVVFAFNVPYPEDVQREAEAGGVRVFHENIIYNLVEGYKRWVAEEKENDRKEAFTRANYPAKIVVLEKHIFRQSNPCVVGIEVLQGVLKKGARLVNEKGEFVGEVKELQEDKKGVTEARKGIKLALSMDEPMFGKQVFEKMVMLTHLSKDDVALLETRYAATLSEEDKDLLREIKLLLKYASF